MNGNVQALGFKIVRKNGADHINAVVVDTGTGQILKRFSNYLISSVFSENFVNFAKNAFSDVGNDPSRFVFLVNDLGSISKLNVISVKELEQSKMIIDFLHDHNIDVINVNDVARGIGFIHYELHQKLKREKKDITEEASSRLQFKCSQSANDDPLHEVEQFVINHVNLLNWGKELVLKSKKDVSDAE